MLIDVRLSFLACAELRLRRLKALSLLHALRMNRPFPFRRGQDTTETPRSQASESVPPFDLPELSID